MATPVSSHLLIATMASLLALGAGCRVNTVTHTPEPADNGTSTAAQTLATSHYTAEVPSTWFVNDVNGDGSVVVLDPRDVTLIAKTDADFALEAFVHERTAIELVKQGFGEDPSTNSAVTYFAEYTNAASLSGYEVRESSDYHVEHTRAYVYLDLGNGRSIMATANIDKYSTEFYQFVDSLRGVH